MNRNQRKVEEYVTRGGRRRIWKQIVSALACVVVFCTTYALILPAITMATICGYEEHIHTDACYQQVATRPVTTLACTAAPHAHMAECYDEAGNLTCGYADFFVHSHSELCVNEAGELVCILSAIAAHTHGDDCYSVPVHQHGEDCFVREKGELICGILEGEGAYTHSEACYEITDEIICGMDESEGHTHSEACYEETIEFICGQEESEGYAHGETCYDESGNLICKKKESAGHTHDDSCKKITTNLICEKEEVVGHTHDDSCKKTNLICEKEESDGHHHEDTCYAWTETLICGQTEGEPEADAQAVQTCELTEIKLHTHSGTCYDEAGALCCPDLEILAHQHSEECLTTTQAAVSTDTLTCGLEEGEDHTHADRCYGTWALACRIEEHTHTYDCYSDTTETTAATTEDSETEEGLLAEEDYGISLWALLPEERIDGGTVADTDITWLITKNEAGEYYLYIDGEGAMLDGNNLTSSPWQDYKSNKKYHLVIGEGVTYIGKSAFYGMNFYSIDFGGVTEIGGGAFQDVSLYDDLTIPGTVKTIGGSAFYNFHKFNPTRKVILSEGVETIGGSAFGVHDWYFSPAQVFHIPSSVKSIGSARTFDCAAGFDVAEDNLYYCSVDGVLYTKDMTTLVRFPARMELDEFTIPATVTTVKDGAFQNAIVKRLIIPDNVTQMANIGGLDNRMQELIYGDNVTFYKNNVPLIEGNGFKNVHLPENTTYTLHSTFAMTWQYVTSPLESLKIPKGVTSINKLCRNTDWVKMPNLKTVIYDAANAKLDTYGINGYATYELTIGKNVDNLPVNFTYIAKQSSDIYFEPENAFVAAEGAFAGTFMPLETLSGTLYADSQGALYRYDAATLMAELVYVSPGIENLTIPATITPEEGVTCMITSVGQDALRQARDLTGITIAIPNNLSVVASYGFANCPTLTSINEATTVDGVIALFPTTTTFGSNAFYNTGLTGAPVFTPDQMDGDNKLAFDQTAEDADIPTMHITVKSETGTWLDNTDSNVGGGGYQLLTGDGLVTTITVGNTDSQTSFYYRVYFQVTGADASLSITPGTTYTYDGQDATCYSTNDPYTVYLEFVPAEGVTASIPVTVTYPSPTTPGGGLTVWGVVQTQASAEANAGQVVSDGSTIQAYWTTRPEDFELVEGIEHNPTLTVAGDGEGGLHPNNDMVYNLTLSRIESEISAYGKDYIHSIDYETYYTLPEGMRWNPDVLAQIKAGNVTVDGEFLYAGETCVAKVVINNMKATSKGLKLDETGENVIVCFSASNRSGTQAEIATGKNIFFRFYKDVFDIDTDLMEAGQSYTITNHVKATLHPVHSSAIVETASVNNTISSSGPKMWLTQNNPSNVYFGEDATVSVLNLDNLGTDYIGTEEGSYSLELRRGNYTQIYYTPENIDKMFSEEFGDDLTLTITDALLGTYTPVKDVTGGTAYIHAGNSDMESRRETLVITKSPNGYSINGTEYAGTAKEALRAVGYAVSGADKWKLNWKLNEADEDFVYHGGHVQLYNVYPTAKNTFQYLTADWTRQFNSGGSVYTWHGGYVLTPARKTIDSGTRAYYVTPEVRVEQAVYNKAGENISTDLRGETGDELTYVLSMTHFGNGAYENLPMVADITGVQNLLVSKADNTALADLGLPEHGDYYLLTPGTYENVSVGIDDEGNKLNAASVTVTETDKGLHTRIKWYFANIEGGNYLKMVEYHTLIDIGLVDSTDYSLASSVYLNDRTGSRLVTPALVGGDATFERTRAFLETVGDTPAGDVPDSDNFSLVGSGDRVTFRVKYRNITETDTVTIRGGTFAEGLPDTLGTYTWVQGSNVVDFRVVTEGEGTTATGLGDWYIGNNYADIQGDRQYMMWPETAAITLAPGGTVYFYYTLEFPTNDPDNASDAWDSMANTLVGESIYADSYVGRYYARTELMLQEPGSVILQKGVYGQYFTHRWGIETSPTRVYYNNPFYGGTTLYVDRYITYYVTLYNGGNARLYLNEIQDQLPEGFRYARLISSGGTSGAVNSIETQGGYKTANQLSSIVGTDDVTYRSAKISATNDEDGLSFTIGAGSGQYAVKYDSARGQYYLSKGEAITFRYMCTIGKATETLDTATNTVSMAYTNYLEAGVEQIGKTQLSVSAPSITNVNDSNDGARLVGISGNNYTLTSQVSVIRGAVKPGVIKITESYLADGMTESQTYGGSVGPEDTVNWKVTLFNDGMLAMTGYKFVDIMPAPYAFEGSCNFQWKDANGKTIFSGTLFTISQRSSNDTVLTVKSDNTGTKSLTINGDPVSVGTMNLVTNVSYGWMNVDLSISRDDKGNEIMTLQFHETLSLAEGGYMELTFSSRNPTTTYANKVYTNQVQLIPTKQEFDTVGQGSELYDGEGNLIGAKNYSAVNVAFGYATTSSVSVSQDAQLGTGADYILIDKDNPVFRYTLSVGNTTDNAMNKLVMIDNLPEEGDHSPFDTDTDNAIARGSAFKVSLADNPDFAVTVTDRNGTVTTLDPSQYTIEYSTATSFGGTGSADWTGDPNEKWTQDSTGARSIRVIINDSTASLIPSKSTVSVSFDAKIDEEVKQGQIAWNSFGYHYGLDGVSIELEAMPLSYGVKIASIPVLENKLVDSVGINSKPAAAPEAEEFTFLIYPGTARSFNTVDSLKESLENEGIAYLTPTVTVAAGNTTSGQVEMDAQDWNWVSGQQYTIVELPTDREYSFVELGTSSTNSYTFTYDPDQKESITCKNLYRPWSISITKVDAMDQTKALAGAQFALYSPNAADQADPDDYAGTVVPLTKFVNEKTWYLVSAETSGADGKFGWTDLLEDTYLLVELKAPDGYQLPTTTGWFIQRIETTEGQYTNKIVNEAGVVLPHTGGAGVTPYTMGGLLLTAAAGILLLYSKQKKRKEEEAAS